MSEPKTSLLPANSSPLEKALDLGFGHLLERVMPPFPELMDPDRTPAAFLPYLAADRAVSEWSTTVSSINNVTIDALLVSKIERI